MMKCHDDCPSMCSVSPDSKSIISWLSLIPSSDQDCELLQRVHHIPMPKPKTSPRKQRQPVDSDEPDPATAQAIPGVPHEPSEVIPELPIPLAALSLERSPTNPSTKSQRSKSPVKRVTATALHPQPIVLRQFRARSPEWPSGLAEMLSVLKRLARGEGIIDRPCHDEMRAASTRDDQIEDLDERAFQPSSDRHLWGPSPAADDVTRIVNRAQESFEEELNEGHWNCCVHTPIFFLALEHELYAGKVGFQQCTTVQIKPRSLIALDHTGKPGESKMMDFVFCLKPSEIEMEAMQTMATQHPNEVPTINQTWYEPLTFRPISLSIETKRSGEGWSAAMLQTGVWVAAQLTKLKQLVSRVNGDTSAIPALPLLVVQGHDWFFLAAGQCATGQTVIWCRINLGSTETAQGVYQIVAALQYLAYWSQNVYRPWFFKNAVPLAREHL